jgi:hypothetical protein
MRVFRVLTVFAAAVLTLFAAGPAAAVEPGWERIPCTSGAIDRAEVTGGNLLTLAGHLDCSASVPKDSTIVPRFGYARYESLGPGEIRVVDLLAYSTAGPTTFAETRPAHLAHEPFGICVVTDYEVRVGCVKVSWGGPGTPVLVEPLATDDPLVDRTIMFVEEWSSSPVCGYCW